MDVSRFGKGRFWRVWRTGCGSISGLLVQDLRLPAPMESADPHLIRFTGFVPRWPFRFSGSRSDLFALTPCRTLRNLRRRGSVYSLAGRFRPAIISSEPARAASRPKGRSEAEKAQSALTRRSQRLPVARNSSLLSLLQNRRSAGFLPEAAGRARSAGGTLRSRRCGATDAAVQGTSRPVMRASTCEEMSRISVTIRSSSRLFSIHSW